jgi:hypothetical protein
MLPALRAGGCVILHDHACRQMNYLRRSVKTLLKDIRRWEVRSARHGFQCQDRYYTAIFCHFVLVMAALAITARVNDPELDRRMPDVQRV